MNDRAKGGRATLDPWQAVQIGELVLQGAGAPPLEVRLTETNDASPPRVALILPRCRAILPGGCDIGPRQRGVRL